MNRITSLTRYAALPAIIFVWVIFIIGMRHTGLHVLDSRPLSYLGVSSFAPYFRLGLVVGVMLMGLFYIYLGRVFKPTKLFRNLYFTGLVMQLIVTFTPYELDGKFQLAHWTAAIILAVSLVLAPWLFAASRELGENAKRVSKAVTLCYLIALVIETGLLVAFDYYVTSELVNLVIFHAWIIYLTFVGNPRTGVAAAA